MEINHDEIYFNIEIVAPDIEEEYVRFLTTTDDGTADEETNRVKDFKLYGLFPSVSYPEIE